MDRNDYSPWSDWRRRRPSAEKIVSFSAKRRRFCRLCCVVALAICVAVADSIHRPKPISVNVRTLRSGDLIFIHGTSFRSLVVQFLEIGNTDYSHVGIIVFDAGSPFVIHADPVKDKVIKEPLSAIVAPNRSSGAAFYRVATASGRPRCGGRESNFLADRQNPEHLVD